MKCKMGNKKYRLKKITSYDRRYNDSNTLEKNVVYRIEYYGMNIWCLIVCLILPILGWLLFIILQPYKKDWWPHRTFNTEEEAEQELEILKNPQDYETKEEIIYEV